ncbi:MAG: GlsB/YeaQ/YmgE family stress response membrane protein [Myxococcota bacterium]
MGIISWIVLGLVVGLIAKWIHPGEDPGGLAVTAGIGVAGAFVGGWLSRVLGIGPGGVTGFDLASLVTATLGAIVLLFVYRRVKG